MKIFNSFFILVLTISITTYAHAELSQVTLCGGKQIVGRIEKVDLVEKNIVIEAKLDTGATMASLSASNIELFKLDGKEWVKFILSISSNHNKVIYLAPVVRYTHILKRSEENDLSQTNYNDIKYSVRPVIFLTIRLGNKQEAILVNLVDRTRFRYPMLLGTDALKKFNVLVDVSQNYLAR